MLAPAPDPAAEDEEASGPLSPASSLPACLPQDVSNCGPLPMTSPPHYSTAGLRSGN
jgi:hypothetical protein